MNDLDLEIRSAMLEEAASLKVIGVPWQELQRKLRTQKPLRHRRRGLYKSWAAALAFVCIGAGGAWLWHTRQSSTVTVATYGTRPWIPQGFDWFNNPGYSYAVEHGLAFGVGQSKTNQAGTVKIIGVFCDDQNIDVLYSYTQGRTGSTQPRRRNGPNTEVSVSGRSLSNNLSDSSFEYHGNTVIVDSGTSLAHRLPNQFALDIRINMFGHKNIAWQFHVPVNMVKIRAATHVYPIHKVVSLGIAGKMLVESIIWGPLGVQVNDKWTHAEGWKQPIYPSLVDGFGRVLAPQGGPSPSGSTTTVRSSAQTEIVQQQTIRLQSSGPAPRIVGIMPITTYTKAELPPSVSVPLRHLPQRMSLGTLGNVMIEHVEFTRQATRVIYRYTGPVRFPLGIFEIETKTGSTIGPTSVRIIGTPTGTQSSITMQATFPPVASAQGNTIQSERFRASDPDSHLVSVVLYSSSPTAGTPKS